MQFTSVALLSVYSTAGTVDKPAVLEDSSLCVPVMKGEALAESANPIHDELRARRERLTQKRYEHMRAGVRDPRTIFPMAFRVPGFQKVWDRLGEKPVQFAVWSPESRVTLGTGAEVEYHSTTKTLYFVPENVTVFPDLAFVRAVVWLRANELCMMDDLPSSPLNDFLGPSDAKRITRHFLRAALSLVAILRAYQFLMARPEFESIAYSEELHRLLIKTPRFWFDLTRRLVTERAGSGLTHVPSSVWKRLWEMVIPVRWEFESLPTISD